MRSLLLTGLLVPLLAGPIMASELFGLGDSDVPGYAGLELVPGSLPGVAMGAGDLSEAEQLVKRAWDKYWSVVSTQIGRVQCGEKATSDRGDGACKYTLRPDDSWTSQDNDVYSQRTETLQSAEEDLTTAGQLLANLIEAALASPPPSATDASITRTGRLVATLKGYNDLVDRATKTQLIRHMQFWRDKRTTVFAEALPRFDVQGLVAHVEPAAFSGGTPAAGRGDLDELVADLKANLVEIRTLRAAYGKARVPDLHHQHRAASGVSRSELVEASARFEAAVTAMAPTVARIRYELEARGLAEESRDPWDIIGSWEMQVNGNRSYWVTWTQLMGYRPMRKDSQVVWHMFPPLYDATEQEQPEKITDRWMPFGRDNGSVMTVGKTRPSLPNS